MIFDKKNNQAVFAIFNTRAQLELAVENLKQGGFKQADISVLIPSEGSAQTLAHEKATKAPEGAAAGATSGIAIGGALGWLIGLGFLTIPGFGPFLAAGPVMTALAGAGLAGTVGGVAGGLIGLGIPEYEAKKFETYVRSGGHLLSVHVDNEAQADQAKEILEAQAAHDIATVNEEKRQDRPPKEGSSAQPLF